MELTRRDAVAALAVVGATGGVAVATRRKGIKTGDNEGAADDEGAADGDDGGVTDGDGNDSLPDEPVVRESMVAVATVLYPDEVDGVEAFVDRFLDGRLDGSAHAERIRAAVGELDDAARAWHDAPIDDLDERDRDRLLREIGADTAEEDPDGTLAERIRYSVVNELLLALYASPTGGELVGLENPQGHPGGTESYRRGPR